MKVRLLGSVVADTTILSAVPIIENTEIEVRAVLLSLQSGKRIEEVAETFHISISNVQDAILYAAEMAGREQIWIALSQRG